AIRRARRYLREAEVAFIKADKWRRANPPPGEKAASAPPAAAAKTLTEQPPRRHWVQIATGADKSALPAEFDRLAGKAPELLGDKAAWTIPVRFTNRLLVGPFASEAEAQALVNALAAEDMAALSWTSAPGEEIEKLPAR
ncbi:MAG: SPOR domain-containing protein, partial [Sphingomonadaceae bacterium]